MDQPVENTNSIDDNPNLQDKRGLVHIEIWAADMEYDLQLMVEMLVAILVDVFYLAKQLHIRPIV
jgi:hypothetical protein